MTNKPDFGQGADGGILAFKPNGTSSGDGSVVARLLYANLKASERIAESNAQILKELQIMNRRAK